MQDFTAPKIVEIIVSEENVVWVNIDATCALRSCGCSNIVITDARLPKYLTANDAAAKLGVSINVFRNLVTRGDLPAPLIVEGKKLWEIKGLEL